MRLLCRILLEALISRRLDFPRHRPSSAPRPRNAASQIPPSYSSRKGRSTGAANKRACWQRVHLQTPTERDTYNNSAELRSKQNGTPSVVPILQETEKKKQGSILQDNPLRLKQSAKPKAVTTDQEMAIHEITECVITPTPCPSLPSSGVRRVAYPELAFPMKLTRRWGKQGGCLSCRSQGAQGRRCRLLCRLVR
jgi:hypothetical protein